VQIFVNIVDVLGISVDFLNIVDVLGISVDFREYCGCSRN
jgi:hypothetical protein